MPDVEFRVGSILGPDGVAGQGERLLAAHAVHWPPELRAAKLKRVNADLQDKLTDRDRKNAAKIAGVDDLAQVTVRGGHHDDSKAVVTYTRVDDGLVTQGFFPYSDLASGESSEHFSQREALLSSEFAAKHADALERERARGAATVADADPFKALANASVDDLRELMADHPERVEAVKAFEQATRGDKARKGILEFEPPEPESAGDND